MKFSPASLPPTTKSSAEKTMFETLQCMAGWDDWTCFHSLRLDKHSYQTCGEIDFLLLGPGGLLGIEVKGGRVTFVDGVWSHTNRYGRTTRDQRGPYRQIEDAMYSLFGDLEQRSSVRDFIKFTSRGWVVAFPDIKFDVSSVEYDGVLTLDESVCAGAAPLADSLTTALGYWRAKKSRFRDLSVDEIAGLSRLIRPSFDKVPTIKSQSLDHIAVSVALTERQYEILDAARINPRIVCLGGAGTGKSFIALEAARRERDTGQRVLFTSLNENLLSFLRHQPDLGNIDFQPWNATTGEYDIVILDEAQDCLDAETPRKLSALLGRSWDTGRWLICLDPNGQANVGGKLDSEALDILTAKSISLRLSLNCRNTGVILSQTKWATKADVGVTGTGHGPLVTWCSVTDANSEARALVHHLDHLIGDEGLRLGDITILDISDGRRTLDALPHQWKSKMRPLTPSLVKEWTNRPITVARVADFKGLENTAICVIGARELSNLTTPVNYLYVAMTRALSHLWVGTTEELGALIEDGSWGDFDGDRQGTNN